MVWYGMGRYGVSGAKGAGGAMDATLRDAADGRTDGCVVTHLDELGVGLARVVDEPRHVAAEGRVDHGDAPALALDLNCVWEAEAEAE